MFTFVPDKSSLTFSTFLVFSGTEHIGWITKTKGYIGPKALYPHHCSLIEEALTLFKELQ